MNADEDRYKATQYQYDPVDQTENIANKRRIIEIMQEMVTAPLTSLDEVVRAGYHLDASIHVTYPINELHSLNALGEKVWKPLRKALPNLERRDDIIAGGRYRGTNWIGCLGKYIGTFENDWLDIPATRGVVAVRYAEGHGLRDGKIITSYIFIDFLDLIPPGWILAFGAQPWV